jgi:hypothetical protein
VTENEYKEEEGLLSRAETVHGTQQLHTFMLVKKVVLNTTQYSASPNYTETHMITMLKDTTDCELKNITGFVAYIYGNFWRSGCELSVSEESSDMKISFFILMDPLHHTYIQLLQIFCGLLNQQFCEVRMRKYVYVCLHEREKMCFQIITAFLCYICFCI